MRGVYQRGRKFWIRYYFEGRMVRESAGEDRRTAEKALQAIHGAIVQGRFKLERKTDQITFEEMSKIYLTEKAAKRSLKRDRTTLAHLLPVFGKTLLGAITRREIEAYRDGRRKAVSGSTVNRELALLRHLLNIGVEKEFLQTNPCARVKKYPEPVSPRRRFVLTEEEVQRLVAAASPHLRPIIALAAGTGLRVSDLLALRWDQVDLQNGVIGLCMKKTQEPLEIPMLPMVREVLLRLQATAGQTPYVFTFFPGEKIGSVKTAFQGALRRSGLKERGFCFHDLRRSFATWLYSRGVGLIKIQRLLGHRSVLTTEKYLGIRYEETRLAIEALNTPGLLALAAPGGTITAQPQKQPLEIPSESVN